MNTMQGRTKNACQSGTEDEMETANCQTVKTTKNKLNTQVSHYDINT